MIAALIIAGIVLGACVFAAMAAAPHTKPRSLMDAEEAERDATASDRDETQRCAEIIAERVQREARRQRIARHAAELDRKAERIYR